MKNIFGLVLALGIAASTGSLCLAQSDSAEVVRVEGNVQARDASGKLEGPPKVGTRLSAGGSLETGADGRAVVRIGKTGFAVLDRKSKLEVAPAKDSLNWLRHVSGWIYYALHRDAARKAPIDVRTTVATIGVRGTRFLVVDVPGRSELGMRKGVVSVESIEGQFELHRTAEKDEFEAYKQQGAEAAEREKEDFRKYEATAQREFTEYTRSFSLGADRQAVFDGKRVREQALSDETRQDMESAEHYAADWLKTVQD